MDVDGFVRDGYVAVRGAVDMATVAACQELIWEGLAGRGVRRDDPRSWPSLTVFNDLGAGPFDGTDPSPVARAIVEGLATAD